MNHKNGIFFEKMAQNYLDILMRILSIL